MIDFDIISTGSKGNAVVLNKHIMVDIGVPFKSLLPHYKMIKLILLTHSHCDHFKAKTVRRISCERPTLRFGCCEWMVPFLLSNGVEKREIDVYATCKQYNYGAFSISSFELMHDVQNCGYKIFFDDGSKLIYATDTGSISHIEAKSYDLYMLEANYDREEIAERIRLKQASGDYCYEHNAVKNHLSRESANDWLYANMGANSRYVYLHGHGSYRDDIEYMLRGV